MKVLTKSSVVSRTAFFFLLSAACLSVQAGEPKFGDRQDLGLIEHDAISEASGLAASQSAAGVLWTHNDRGGDAVLFALSTAGKHLGVFQLDGVSARDWEDMASGPGPVEGQTYLYVGDIGDNQGGNDFKFIYRIPEPVVSATQSPVELTVSDFDRLVLQYPDGNRDAETLMIDPLTRDLYIVSKQEDSVRVYQAPSPQSATEIAVMQHGATLNLKGDGDGSATVAGDISPDGREILIKTLKRIYYWCRGPGETVFEALQSEPVSVPYVEEPQGEAVAWAADSSGYFTLSEETQDFDAHLFFYAREKATSVRAIPAAASTITLRSYPNPFNPETTLRFVVDRPAPVRLVVFDVLGRQMALLVDRRLPAGEHSRIWSAAGQASGLYIAQIRVGATTISRKLLLVK